MKMAEEIKRIIYQLMSKVDGLLAVAITDRDGVPVLKVAQDTVPDLSLRPGFLSTFGMATDQASKMGLGKNKTIICMYASYQVIHFNKLPLVVSLVAASEANTGCLLNLDKELEEIVQSLIVAVADS